MKVFAKMNQAKDDLRARRLAVIRDTIDVVDMDVIGVVINSKWVLWFTGEEDKKIWTWGQQS